MLRPSHWINGERLVFGLTHCCLTVKLTRYLSIKTMHVAGASPIALRETFSTREAANALPGVTITWIMQGRLGRLLGSKLFHA